MATTAYSDIDAHHRAPSSHVWRFDSISTRGKELLIRIETNTL